MLQKSLFTLLMIASALTLTAAPSVNVAGVGKGFVRQEQSNGEVLTAEIQFDLKQNGDQVSGIAAPTLDPSPPQITDTKLEAKQLTFTVLDHPSMALEHSSCGGSS